MSYNRGIEARRVLAVRQHQRAVRRVAQTKSTREAFTRNLIRAQHKYELAVRAIEAFAAQADWQTCRSVIEKQGPRRISGMIRELLAANPMLRLFFRDYDATLRDPAVFVEAVLQMDVNTAKFERDCADEVLDFFEGSEEEARHDLAEATTALNAALAALERVERDLLEAVEQLADLEALESVPIEPKPKHRPPIRLRHIETRSVLTAAPPARVFALAA